MNSRTFPKWLMAVVGVIVLTVLVPSVMRELRWLLAKEVRAFSSPDGRFKIMVYRIPMLFAMPGQGSDAPGYLQLRDARTGRVLHERHIEMIQLVDRIHWTPTNVNVRLLADWRLPQ